MSGARRTHAPRLLLVANGNHHRRFIVGEEIEVARPVDERIEQGMVVFARKMDCDELENEAASDAMLFLPGERIDDVLDDVEPQHSLAPQVPAAQRAKALANRAPSIESWTASFFCWTRFRISAPSAMDRMWLTSRWMSDAMWESVCCPPCA